MPGREGYQLVIGADFLDLWGIHFALVVV